MVSLPSGNALNFVIIGGVVIIAIIAITRGLQSVSGLSLFGNGDKEEKTQTSDSTAELGRLEAELQRALAEAKRLESEADRADSEGRRGDAEQFRALAEQTRAEAELLRAQNDKLAIELSAKAGTLDANVIIGDEESRTKDASTTTQDEANAQEITQTPSGQNETDIAPDTEVQGKDPDVEIVVASDDAIAEAIEKASNAKTRGALRFNRTSFFDFGASEQIIVESSPDINILGGGSAGKPASFTIREIAPRTLSDVIKLHPEFSASQARDFLAKRGVQSTDPRVQEVQQKKFDAFDFGTSTGSGFASTKELSKEFGGRVTQSAIELERLRAEEKLKQILSSENIDPNTGQDSSLSTVKSSPTKRTF